MPEQLISAALNDIWNRYASSLNAGDVSRWLELWTEDGVQMPPDEPAVVGKDQIRARNGAVLDQFTFNMKNITNLETEESGDLAFARGSFNATLTPKGSGEPIVVDGKYLTILKRQPDGSWKIHRDAFNSNVSPGQ